MRTAKTGTVTCRLFMFVLLLLTPELHGVDHEVVYAEGYPYIRDREGMLKKISRALLSLRFLEISGSYRIGRHY